MKQLSGFLSVIFLTIFFGLSSFAQTSKDQRYIFFLHNAYVEQNDLNVPHPEYGKAEYNEILASYRKDGFIVSSEIRSKNTNAKKYAKKIVKQVKALLKQGFLQIK